MYTDNDFIRFDWAAKYILRDKSDYEVFEGLMTVLIGEPIKIVELLESESNKETKGANSNRVDIKASNSKEEIILVEIWLENKMSFCERVFNWPQFNVEYCSDNSNYDGIGRFYSIHIVYFNLGHGRDYLYYGTNRFIGVNIGDTLVINEKESRGFKRPKNTNIFPEYYIIRVNQFEVKSPQTPLEEWMRYLQTGYIKPDTTVPGLQKARQKLRVLSMSDQDRKEYEYYLYNKVYEEDIVETAREDGYEEGYDAGEESGLNKGLEKGMEMGKAEEREKTIRKMKSMGLDDSVIEEIFA